MNIWWDLLYPEHDRHPRRTRVLRALFVVAAAVVLVLAGIAKDQAIDQRRVPSDPVGIFSFALPMVLGLLVIVGLFAAVWARPRAAKCPTTVRG